jgi:ribosomal protein S18 acetylase RimI-like enzyme
MEMNAIMQNPLRDPLPTVPELPVDRERGQEIIPRCAISIRLATTDDLPFIDALQKKHHKQLGFFPRAQMEGYIKNGWVLVAEQAGSRQRAAGSEGTQLPTACCQPPALLGYIASRDRYQKRDELGAIFQLCVDDCAQRKLVGAMLLKEVFEQSPYGCKLFCCWCAQDIEANHFWEAMGFVPLAFRAGSAKKGRVHIFWQRRIRAGDETTPYWFPSQTGGGAIGEDRLVLPIPPGMHWSDEMPRVLPQELPVASGQLPEVRQRKQIAGPKIKASKAPERRTYCISRSKLHFGLPKPVKESKDKPPREKRKAMKNDPKLVAAARELRDRWMEQVNSGQYLPAAQGKYEVSRSLVAPEPKQPMLLPAA